MLLGGRLPQYVCLFTGCQLVLLLQRPVGLPGPVAAAGRQSRPRCESHGGQSLGRHDDTLGAHGPPAAADGPAAAPACPLQPQPAARPAAAGQSAAGQSSVQVQQHRSGIRAVVIHYFRC